MREPPLASRWIFSSVTLVAQRVVNSKGIVTVKRQDSRPQNFTDKLKLFELAKFLDFFSYPICPPPFSGFSLSPHTDTHTHTHTHTHTGARQDSSGGMIGSSQRPLLDNTKYSQETDNHTLRRDSNPQPQQSSGPQTHTLDRAVIGIGRLGVCLFRNNSHFITIIYIAIKSG